MHAIDIAFVLISELYVLIEILKDYFDKQNSEDFVRIY